MTEKRHVLICNCNASQKIDAQGIAQALDLPTTPKVHEQLCRSQIEAVESLAGTDAPVTICCTQEAPIFLETWDEALGGEDQEGPVFVNIREHAGWSEDGTKAAPKMAALIAAAQTDMPATTLVSMTSEGRIVILGRDQAAIESARRLTDHLDVTVCLETADDVLPAPSAEFAVFRGTVVRASGHLGAFKVTCKSLAALDPSSRGSMSFAAGGTEPETLEADMILDLRGAPALFPAPEKRDGYLRPAPGNPAALERALFDAINLVGDFEKPRYVKHTAHQCAHARNGIVGCTRCLDACPTSAIQPDGDHVAIDAYICAGCGECATVCPTGANSYLYPSTKGLLARARVMLSTYRKLKGPPPVFLLGDTAYGEEAVAMMARFGRGLPARVMPVFAHSIASCGLDSLLALAAYGAARVVLLANPAQGEEMAPLVEQVGYANAILDGFGHGMDRVIVIDDADPMAVEERLWSLPEAAPMGHADFIVEGGKRETLSMALNHLRDQAPARPDRIALPEGAPFGDITIDEAGCTLCLACTSACPASALKSNPDRPELRFLESACVQCGLCRSTCPEKVMTLSPGIDLTGAARNFRTLKVEEPFECIRCGTPFGTKSSIERMVEKLQGHSMFQDERALNRLKMCEVCRVADMTEHQGDPFSNGAVPRPRTTDDYLRDREALRKDAPPDGSD